MRKYLTHNEIQKLSLEEMLNITSSEGVPDPSFTSQNTSCVHNLFYSWHAVLSELREFPSNTSEIIEQCIPLWANDGFECLQFNHKSTILQILCKVQPEISPEKFSQKIKGRLTYAFKQSSVYLKFSRALGFRALGFNTSEIVKNYIKGQFRKEDLADSRYREVLKQFTESDNSILFAEAHKNKRSRYWYNIHLVIVIADRTLPLTKNVSFEKIKNLIPRIAEKHNHKVADFAIMPDHIHIALQADPKETPYEIGLSFLNNLTYAMKMRYFWRNEFYVGTFSEYSLNSLGINQTSIPTRQARG
jgi:REP element-mobilizing transposase RayT